MPESLLQALALVLVIEGLMPFLSPARFRRGLLRAAAIEDRWLRLFGLAAMLGGLLLLQALN